MSGVGAFVDGLFAGAESTTRLLEARDRMMATAKTRELQDATTQQVLKNNAQATIKSTFTPDGTDTLDLGSSAVKPAEGVVPEFSGSSSARGRGAPTPDQAALIQKAADQYNIPSNVLTGLLGVESDFNPRALGPPTKYGRAKGLGQFIDSTASGLGVTDPFDITQAIPAAARYLRQGLDAHGGDMTRALMYYHGGPDQRQWGPITQAYPGAVLGRAKQFGVGSDARMALPEVPTAGGLPAPTIGAAAPDYAAPNSGLAAPAAPAAAMSALSPPTVPAAGSGLQRGLTEDQYRQQNPTGILGGPGGFGSALGGSGGGAPAAAAAGAGGDGVPSPDVPGNINLYNRPQAPMPDGSTATVYSMSFGTPKGEILVPQISDDGRLMSPDEAKDQYYRTGKHLGIFRDPKAATAYAKKLHRDQEKLFGKRPAQKPSALLY